ncbi:MAG: hypothetical protein ABI780_13395 [Ardenticatenales bacterium]
MNPVRMLTAVMILGLAPIACTRPTATPTTDAAAESERATREYAHGALIQTPTPTTGPEVAATGRALPSDPTTDEMRDGRHIAFIQAIVPGAPPQLAVNPAVMFGGDEADAASIADGSSTRSHALPNGYYIRDLDPATLTLPLSPTAVVSLTLTADKDHDMAETTVTVDDFVGWFAGTPISAPDDRLWYGAWNDPVAKTDLDGRLLFWITTRDGVVVNIAEQFRP